MQSFHTYLLLTIICINHIYGLDRIKLNKNGYFIDSKNYVKLFHGLNNIKKYLPFYPVEITNETKLALFQQWGINVIRLGVIWPAVQPSEKVTNYTYLNAIENIVDLAAKYNIYIILDMHQDVLSTRFNNYDGIPLWVLDKLKPVPSILKFPWPFFTSPSVMLGYLTYECANAMQQIYDNVSNVWNDWGNYWEVVARRFRTKSNVLGYELINEPPPGNFYERPMTLFPGYAGRHNLLPVYNYLVSRIRAVDNDTLIFYEPITYSVFTKQYGEMFGTGFSKVPGSDQYVNASEKSVLSYHHYCWLLQLVPSSENMPLWKRIFCDDYLLPRVFKNAKNAIKITGGGKFLTEFGLCGADGNPHSINTIECDAVLQQADESFESWTFWGGNFLDKNGNPIWTQVQSFIRPYPHSTDGVPLYMHFKPNSFFLYIFDASRKSENKSKVIAQIYIPTQVHYKTGFNVKVYPKHLEINQTTNFVSIIVPSEYLYNSLRVYVTISKSQNNNTSNNNNSDNVNVA